MSCCFHIDIPALADKITGSEKRSDAPLTPQDIVNVLLGWGWEARIYKATDASGELFKRFDKDKDGNVDLAELKEGLEKELNVSMTRCCAVSVHALLPFRAYIDANVFFPYAAPHLFILSATARAGDPVRCPHQAADGGA